MATTSKTLLLRLKNVDDQAAWKRFVELYTPLLFFWAKKSGLSPADAGDFVQELLLTLVKKLPDFVYDPVPGQSGRFRAWLRTVANNRWRDVQKRRRPKVLPPDDDAFEQPVRDDAEQFWDREYGELLRARALEIMQAEFETKTWQACWETVVNGRPTAEVARELGMTDGAVYVAKSRVLHRVREELAGLLDDE